ncbi:DUF6090 family protein [Rhodohalobacter mucosus]|nr:DUF6090 family protein [Rhodohalobacter mucosus]
MEQNKVRTYIFYAIGEILLVVIGILIALQVNNWNEERKLANEEQIILNALYEEISSNQQIFKGAITRAENVQKSIYSILSYTGPGTPELTKERSDSLIQTLDAVITAEVNQGILNDLMVTGRIHLIQNDSLKHQLTSWVPLYQDEVLEPETSILHSVQNIIIPFLVEHYSMATEGFNRHSGYETRFSHDYRKIYQLIEFENIVLFKEIDYYVLINSYKTMIAYNEGLLEHIRLERKR